MSFKMIRSLVILYVVLTVVVICANAESVTNPEKQALIKELLVVMDFEENARSTLELTLAHMERNFSQNVAQQIEANKDLKPEERERMTKMTVQSQDHFRKAFRELMTQRLNYLETIAQITSGVYDKFYTADEIKDLITFYRTPTGKKSIQVMPQLTAETMQRVNESIMPKMMQITKELMDAEKKTSPK